MPSPKQRPFVIDCPLRVFERHVVLLVGPVMDATERLAAEKSIIVPRCAIREVRAALKRVGDVQGCCVKSYGDVYVWLPVWKSKVVVHELYHATKMVLDFCAITEDPNNEIGAWIIEHLFHTFCNTKIADLNLRSRK